LQTLEVIRFKAFCKFSAVFLSVTGINETRRTQMASITKRRNGDGSTTWDAMVRIVGYPATGKSFRTKLAAEVWAANTEARAKGGTLACARGMTLSALMDEALPRLKHPCNAAFAHWRGQLGDVPIAKITPDVIAFHRDRLLGAPCSGFKHKTAKPRAPATVDNYLIELSRLFTLAVREMCVMDVNPCANVKKPGIRNDVVRFLSDDERAALLNACKASESPDLYAFVLFALTTGARKGEIAALLWSRCDLKRRWAIFPKTKNGDARGVPLTAAVCASLAARPRDHERVFPVDITRAWHTAIARAGITDFRFHDLRHSCASACWGNDTCSWHGHKREMRYVLDYLQFRYLPALLSEVQLAIGKYADAVRQLTGYRAIVNGTYRWFAGPAGFNVYIANTSAGGDLAINARLDYFTDGSLAYASSSDRTEYPPPNPPTSVPTNRAELGYFKLKLGNACLEWADALYRTNEPDSIMRARELYKAVIFVHGQDPEITPFWERRGAKLLPPFPWKSSASNPAVVSQVNRARLGFLQINAGLNYYAVSPTHVPPVRFRVLKESADRFAAGARGAQSDFLSYVQQLDTLTVSEMNARTMVAKASAAISIAQEQQKIAEFYVGEAQKQVDAINGQIAAKIAEIAKKDEFFEQAKDFAGGMVDSMSKLGEMAFAGEGEPGAASASNLSTGDVLKLGYKVGTASNVLGAGSSALAGAAGVAGPFGAFLYAGVTSITAVADAIAKRAGELKQLQNVALPAAKALVDLKKRDITIAQLSQNIAKADWQLGKDLLAYFAQRLLNRSFLVSMIEFSNRLMRRYLDLAGRTAWIAERALAFEQDRELGIIAFDYFPRNLRGVSGADVLQLHLAELEAARIQGLTQTIPVKHTISLARDYPMAFGQLKSTGLCQFMTTEEPLRSVYPGVYGYRVRNITIGAAYAEPIQPHRGLLSNQGVSVLTRGTLNSAHTLVRYPDVLPLSEFRMREDMWVFDLPDETLLPFEGSGIETVWELMLPKAGNVNSFESITDVMITFDMRASYSASLRTQQLAALPASANRSVLVSANTMNPGVLADFRVNGGLVSLDFDLAKATFNANEVARTTINVVLMAVGLKNTPFDATFSSMNPAQSEVFTFEKGVALSNAGALADGNGGVPLPLNTFTGIDTNQTFRMQIDANANPGVDFSQLTEVMLLAEYQADF